MALHVERAPHQTAAAAPAGVALAVAVGLADVIARLTGARMLLQFYRCLCGRLPSVFRRAWWFVHGVGALSVQHEICMEFD